jgi:hypothetical protein
MRNVNRPMILTAPTSLSARLCAARLHESLPGTLPIEQRARLALVGDDEARAFLVSDQLEARISGQHQALRSPFCS